MQVSEISGEISIHAPREGSDAIIPENNQQSTVFLSTLPARGATTACLSGPMRESDFYPRSPRGERPVACVSQTYVDELFLSTLPARGATINNKAATLELSISIHAPREGSDSLRPAAARIH